MAHGEDVDTFEFGRGAKRKSSVMRHVCGCRLTTVGKRRQPALRCPVPGTKGMVRFIKRSQVAAYRGRKNICTNVLDFAAARRSRKSRKFSFRTDAGKTVSFGRKPSIKTAKKMTAFYYSQLRKRLLKSHRKPRYQPSFAGWGR
jgi:hypothetical protein